MTTSYILNNGEKHEADVPLFTPLNRSFRYGDSVFESIRVFNGSPLFMEEHYGRILQTMKILKMKPDENYSAAFFTDEIKRLCAINHIEKGGRVRFTVFRNDGGNFTPSDRTCSYIIEAVPLENNEYVLPKNGMIVDLFLDYKKPVHPLSNLKTGNSLFCVLAGIYASEKGLDEVFIMNAENGIAEASAYNVFIVFNGELYTPLLSEGGLDGVMRRTLIKIAAKNKIKITECKIEPGRILAAEEVFLTNAIHGIRWVGAFRNKRYYKNQAVRFTDLLNRYVEMLV